jgi:hypothetical protein
VYLVNALVPPNPRIGIADQRRDRAQHGLTLDYSVTPSPALAWNFMLLAGLAVAGRLVLRGRGRLPRFGILVALVGFGLEGPGRAETGLRDPEFSKLPFEQWLAEGERTGINWSAEILPAEISTHQRLMLRIVIRVDGRFLEKHRGASKFVTLVQYKDQNDRIWQHHTSLDLSKLAPGIQTHQLAIAQYAFVLPGDYSLAIAICDTATLEHNLIFRQAHAEPLKGDPLPEAWTGLPAVEFIPAITEPPDVWYLPGIEGGLNLSVATRRRVHIQLLVNTTPSAADSLAAMWANMSAVIPALKVLSQIDIRNGSLDVAFLDLTQRRVVFEQKNAGSLVWAGVRDILLGARPGLVDVRDLEGQGKMQEFFRDEVGRRLAGRPQPGSDGESQIVIILSGPAFLKDQEPLSLLDGPPDADRRLFYVRFVNYPAMTPGRKGRRGAATLVTQSVPVDDLERALEPLHARLYDATSVEEFRRILADVLDRISQN